MVEAPAPAVERKTYTLDQCKQNVSEKSCWIIVHGKVYDVTEFLEEHPGGFDIILSSAGKDATQDFEEIGHSNSAREMLEKMFIGDFAGGDSAPIVVKAHEAKTLTPKQGTSTLKRIFHVLLPILLILAAIIINLTSAKKPST